MDDPLRVTERLGGYPHTDPFLQTFDFELESPLALYHSSSGGDYAVRLKDGTELSVSRARRDELEQRLGVQ